MPLGNIWKHIIMPQTATTWIKTKVKFFSFYILDDSFPLIEQIFQILTILPSSYSGLNLTFLLN